MYWFQDGSPTDPTNYPRSLAFQFAQVPVHDEGNDVGQSLVQTCKKRVAGSFLCEVMVGVQLLCGFPIAICGQMHIRYLGVQLTFHPTGTVLAEGIFSERSKNFRVCACSDI